MCTTFGMERTYHFLRDHYFHCMLLRFDTGAVSVCVNLGKLCPKEKNLRGIVDPQKQSYKGTCCAIGRTGSATSQVETQNKFADAEKNCGQRRTHPNVTPSY